jgi:alkaline phosphatase D
MRIAFVSCIATAVFPQQPVWTWIAAQKPDFLVLLGDSLYLDVHVPSTHPSAMSDDDFAKHLHHLYTQLIQQPDFAALVQAMPNGRVFSTWDDHDFLWNDALGAEEGRNPVHTGKIRLSTAFQEAFRRALAASLKPDSFPTVYNSAEFWDLNQPPLTTPSVLLGEDTWLHLSDVRTWRTRHWLLAESRRGLLGRAQRSQFESVFAASSPDAVHLFASGSTAASYKRHYPQDWMWLLNQAAARRTLMLSGDIHRNESDAFFTQGWPLHEATSSGAAVKDAVVVGTTRRNYGLLDINAEKVSVTLYAQNRLEKKWSRTIDRRSWLPT